MAPALPPSGQFLSSVRRTSKDLRIASGILVHADNIKRLLISPAFTESFERVSKDHGLLLPLNFPSHLEELNFISILSLLNFASGFRVPLHTQTGRGAWDSIRAFCFSLFITSTTDGDLLSSKGMQSLSIAKIAELMGISLHVEKPHSTIPGITVGELGGPLYELVTKIHNVLKETGQILDLAGYSSLGLFVAQSLQQAGKVPNSSDDAPVEIILENLVRAFPAFQDMSMVDDKPIYCFKKALFLIHAIQVRFGSISPPPFFVPKTHKLPVFSDNVLPSLLTHLGVITVPSTSSLSQLFPEATISQNVELLLGPAPPLPGKSSDASKTVPKEGPIVTMDQSYILRAAAIDACEVIVETAHELDSVSVGEGVRELTLPDLDMWLWAVAKDRPDYRRLGRFVDQNTIYF